MNDKFIGISEDVGRDTLVSVGLAGLFILVGMWNDLFTLGTPKSWYFSSEIAALSFEWQFLIVVVVAPIIEETAFRFFLFGFCSDSLDRYAGLSQPARIAITTLIVSVCFAAFHFAAYGTSLQTAYIGAFVFSVMACGVMLWRQSQIPNTVMHMCINFSIFWGVFVVV